MGIAEAQRLGSAAVLLITLTVYGISLLCARFPIRESPLPWGIQDPSKIVVELQGDWGMDGLYFLPKGMSVGQALSSLGIPESRQGGIQVNHIISKASVITMSLRGDAEIQGMSAGKMLALGLPVDLNRLSREELSLVPGIGEKTADQIVRLRTEMGGFRRLEDLMAVPGIKEKKWKGLKGYLVVERAGE